MLSRELKQGDVTASDWVIRDSFSWNLNSKESGMKVQGEERTSSNAGTSLALSHYAIPSRDPLPIQRGGQSPHTASVSWSLQCSTQKLCSGLLPACSFWGNALLHLSSGPALSPTLGFAQMLCFQ